MKLGSNLGEQMHLQLRGKSSKRYVIGDPKGPCVSILKSPQRKYECEIVIVSNLIPWPGMLLM